MADPDAALSHSRPRSRTQIMAPPMMQMPSLQMPGMGLPQTEPSSPPPTPGFNNVGVPTPAGWLPQNVAGNIGSAIGSMLPSWDSAKQGLAETLGAPVDSAAWLLMKAGLPIPRAPTMQPYADGAARGTWAPSASVPFGSQNIGQMLDTPPNVDALLQALRHRGLF